MGCGSQAFNTEQMVDKEGSSALSQVASTWGNIKAGRTAMRSDSRELSEYLHLQCSEIDQVVFIKAG